MHIYDIPRIKFGSATKSQEKTAFSAGTPATLTDPCIMIAVKKFFIKAFPVVPKKNRYNTAIEAVRRAEQLPLPGCPPNLLLDFGISST